ncbi:hypothetical protein AL037_01500 [Salipiger aestuarii]|nr:hypothetical protein AL037_01500 [Salipiger aestuarii]
MNDIIALRCYQRFMAAGQSSSASGAKACAIRGFLAEHPEADRVFIVKTVFDDGDAESGEYRQGYLLTDFDAKDSHIKINARQSLDVVSVEVLNFHYLRGRIVHEIEDAARVVGSED